MSITCTFCNTRIEDAKEEGRVECPRCGAPLGKGFNDADLYFDPAPRSGSSEECPECGSKVAFQEGCMACINPACGWSACG